MLDDLYARADEVLEGLTPAGFAAAKAALHSIIAEAALIGNRYGYDRSTPDNPQARRYCAVVQVRRGGRMECDEIQFSSIPGPLTTERAAEVEALYRFGSASEPYVIRTSIQRV